MIIVVGPSAARAQQGDVGISSLDCGSDPETVTILNSGTEPVDLSGWSLQSDPAASETFDLSPIQTLAGGASVTVEAGPAASGAFVWSQSELLRDDDYTDFARLVDADGATVSEEACGTAPDPSPTPAPADMPNGGGPPAPTSSGLATILVLAGAGLSTMALAIVTLAFVPAGQVLSQVRARFLGSDRSDRDEPAMVPAVPHDSITATSIASIAAVAVLVMLLITFALRDRGSR